MGNWNWWSLVTAVAVVAAGLPGCSFIFSEGPPARHEERVHFDCGRSYAPPVLDAISTGVMALGASATRNDETIENRDAAVGIQLAMAVIAGASAVYGFTVVSRCNDAQELRLARNARQQALPPPYGLPPYWQPPASWPPPTFQLSTPAPAPALAPSAQPPSAAPPAPPPPAPAPPAP